MGDRHRGIGRKPCGHCARSVDADGDRLALDPAVERAAFAGGDEPAALLGVLATLIGLIVIVYSRAYIPAHIGDVDRAEASRRARQYVALMLLFMAAMLVLACARDPSRSRRRSGDLPLASGSSRPVRNAGFENHPDRVDPIP